MRLRVCKLVFSIEMKETAISLLEEDYNPEQIKDRSNVEELAKHQEIAEKLEFFFYFCKQKHPLGMDFSGITDELSS